MPGVDPPQPAVAQVELGQQRGREPLAAELRPQRLVHRRVRPRQVEQLPARVPVRRDGQRGAERAKSRGGCMGASWLAVDTLIRETEKLCEFPHAEALPSEVRPTTLYDEEPELETVPSKHSR